MKIASSTYYVALTRLKSAREIRDEELQRLMQRVYDENYKVYGARKMWWELHREGIGVGRCRVERLMPNMGLVRNNGSGRRGSRGEPVRITVSDKDGSWAPELVKRQFHGGRAEPVAGGGFHLCFHLGGTAYTAFGIDVFSRRIVRSTCSMSKETDRTRCYRNGIKRRELYYWKEGEDELVHHSDAGSQYHVVPVHSHRS